MTTSRFLVLIGMTLTGLWLQCHAQSVPALINYQGKLTDASGNPLPNGTYGVAVRIWNKKSSSESGNVLVWGQEYNVAVLSGVFNVILGTPGGSLITNAAVNDIGFAFAESERFIGLTVTKGTNGALISGGSEIVPRQQVLSTPFALRAENATSTVTASNGVPAGTVLSFAGAQAPTGFLLCDGRAVSRLQYATLYQTIGIAWNLPGTPGDQFNLPDLRGRTAVGAGQGGGLTTRVLAATGGEEMHQLTILEMPTHHHNLKVWGDSDASKQQIKSTAFDSPLTKQTEDEGGNQPHNNMQPFAVLNYIIKY